VAPATATPGDPEQTDIFANWNLVQSRLQRSARATANPVSVQLVRLITAFNPQSGGDSQEAPSRPVPGNFGAAEEQSQGRDPLLEERRLAPRPDASDSDHPANPDRPAQPTPPSSQEGGPTDQEPSAPTPPPSQDG
jgi:hypothetical protein